MDQIQNAMNSFSGGNNEQKAGGQQSSSGGSGNFLGGLGNKINTAAGGGPESEKNEDLLDKGETHCLSN